VGKYRVISKVTYVHVEQEITGQFGAMVFLTSATLTALLAATAQATSYSSGATVKVNSKIKYQKYDGTGVSEAFQRSLVMHELDLPSQKLALDLLFTTKGAGMTILRNGLGSSPNDGWDLMKSIAPEAPASNSSQVRLFVYDRWTLLSNFRTAQLHSTAARRPVSGLAFTSSQGSRCTHLRG
jgi:hypothetical protein